MSPEDPREPEPDRPPEPSPGRFRHRIETAAGTIQAALEMQWGRSYSIAPLGWRVSISGRDAIYVTVPLHDGTRLQLLFGLNPVDGDPDPVVIGAFAFNAKDQIVELPSLTGLPLSALLPELVLAELSKAAGGDAPASS